VPLRAPMMLTSGALDALGTSSVPEARALLITALASLPEEEVARVTKPPYRPASPPPPPQEELDSWIWLAGWHEAFESGDLSVPAGSLSPVQAGPSLPPPIIPRHSTPSPPPPRYTPSPPPPRCTPSPPPVEYPQSVVLDMPQPIIPRLVPMMQRQMSEPLPLLPIIPRTNSAPLFPLADRQVSIDMDSLPFPPQGSPPRSRSPSVASEDFHDSPSQPPTVFSTPEPPSHLFFDEEQAPSPSPAVRPLDEQRMENP
jgi:hypothetical protein